MDIKSVILDRELDTIFNDCPRDRFDNARVQNLIDACVEKYADGQPEIKNILLQRMDPNRENSYITRSVFKSKVKEWMMAASGNYSEVFESSDECADLYRAGYVESLASSTPLKTPLTQLSKRKLLFSNLNGSDFDSPSVQHHNSLREMNVWKDKNESLENNLVKAEQRIHSLETKLTKQKSDMHKKLQSFEAENQRLSSLVTEYQEKCLILEENCEKYKLNNEKLVAEGEHLKEIEKKNEDLEIKFARASEELIKNKTDLRKMETLVYHLNIELRETKESKESIEKELNLFKAEMNDMLFNQKELNNRIAELHQEKQTLQNELSDARALEQLNSSSYSLQYTLGEDNYSCFPRLEDQRESGISIKSEMNDVLVCGSCSKIFQNNNSSSFSLSPTKDESSCVLPLLNSSRIATEEIGVQTTSGFIATSGKSSQTDEIPIHPTPSRLLTEDIGIQTLDVISKPSFDSKKTQTIEVLASHPMPSFDSKETQTIEVLASHPLRSMDSKECQTMNDDSKDQSFPSEENEALMTEDEGTSDPSFRSGAGDTPSTDLIHSRKRGNISSILRLQVMNFRQANYNSLPRSLAPTDLVLFHGHQSQTIRGNRPRRWCGVITLFLLVASFLLFIGVGTIRHCRLQLIYPRGPPPT